MRQIDVDALQREFMKYHDNPAQYVWNCSECGKRVNGYPAVVLTDYCPQCGSYNGGAE